MSNDLPRVLKKAAVRIAFPLAALVLWLAVGKVGVLDDEIVQAGNMICGVVFFVLAIPLSFVIRLDLLSDRFSEPRPVLLLCIAAGLACLNIFLLSAGITYLRSLRKKPADKPGAAEDGAEKQ
jgi:hypothetical protein